MEKQTAIIINSRLVRGVITEGMFGPQFITNDLTKLGYNKPKDDALIKHLVLRDELSLDESDIYQIINALKDIANQMNAITVADTLTE